MLLCGLGDSNSSSPYEYFPLGFFFLLGALLIAYNKWLKHIPLLKNMTVAFLCTTPLLYALMDYLILSNLILPGNDYAQEHIWAIIPAIPFAFLLTTAREIYKDLEDETGDLKAGIMTFPLIAGSATARRLAGAIIVFTWISLPLPVFYMDKVFGHSYPPLFLIITGIALTPIFAYVLVQARKGQHRKSQSAVKIAMFAGLIALIICA
jgi:4-hydroxybenzoate polyprenyltransferase